MQKLKLACKQCGYIWYPEKERWEKYPNAKEPDCPNEQCPNFGTGFHNPQPSIWEVKETITVES